MTKTNYLSFYQHLVSNHKDIAFDRIPNTDFTQALTWAIEQADKAIDTICMQKSAPSFQNTIVALEQTGREVDAISSLFFNLFHADTNPVLQSQVASKVREEEALRHVPEQHQGHNLGHRLPQDRCESYLAALAAQAARDVVEPLRVRAEHEGEQRVVELESVGRREGCGRGAREWFGALLRSAQTQAGWKVRE